MTTKETLQKAKDALDLAIRTKYKIQNEADRKALIENIGKDLAEGMQPLFFLVLEKMEESGKLNNETFQDLIKKINFNPTFEIPQAAIEVKMPEVKIPEIKLPTITIPKIELPVINVPEPRVTVNLDPSKIKIPDIIMPDEMEVRGWVNLQGYDKGLLLNPLPVQLRDAKGNPIQLFENLKQIISSGGSGGATMMTVINDAAHPIPISGTISATFSADFGAGAAGAQTLRTIAATDSVQSVFITGGSSAGTEYADGTARGTATGTLLMLDDGSNIQSARGGPGNADSRTMRVVHASDAIVSVNVVSGSFGDVGSGEIGGSTLRTVQATDATSSVNVTSWGGVAVKQAQGDGASATGMLNVLPMVVSPGGHDRMRNGVGEAVGALRVVHAGDVGLSVSAAQSGTWNITALSSITNSIAAVLVDSTGVAFSGSNPLPTTASVTLAAAIGQGDSASALRTIQAGDSISSVSTVPANTFGADGLSNEVVRSGLGLSNGSTWDRARNTSGEGNALRVQQSTDSVSSVSAAQTGVWNITTLTGITNSLAATLVDSSGVAYSGSNPFPVSASLSASAVQIQDGQASSITSHQLGDYRGLDVTTLRTITIESALNSSVSTLLSAAAFTGLAEDVKDYSVVQVVIFADQASAADGLSLQQSIDGTNWDVTDVFTVPASIGKTYSVQVAARYFRIVYTNGGTNQGAFRLGSYLHQDAPKSSSQRPSDGRSNENDFIETIGYLSALNVSGTWDRVRMDAGNSIGALRVVHASDAIVSVNIVSDNINLNQTTDSISVIQVSGAIDSVSAAQAGTWNITAVTSITNSVAASLVDSGGVGYNGANPLPVTIVSGAGSSTIVVGDIASDAVDTSSAPNKIGGIARVTNPTAVSDGDRVSASYDKIGRNLNRPIQVRDLLATAYTTLTNGSEATILTAGAGTYLDLIFVSATNTSTAAIQIDLRCTSGGGIIHSFLIPASTGPMGFNLPTPWPQDSTGNAWTADMGDFTNTTVYLSSLFSKEV